MVHRRIESDQYITDFKSKFDNFLAKAPILVSVILTPQSVTIIHENSGTQYIYDWDFTKHVKSFIHDIKIEISKHYPRLRQVIEEKVKLSPQEQADWIAENDGDLKNVPSERSIVTSRLWRIDKCIVYRDRFILVDEETENSFLYKMNRSCTFFLKNYRNGEFPSLEAAGEYFFNNSTFLSQLEKL
jgi:hypothetical protein